MFAMDCSDSKIRKQDILKLHCRVQLHTAHLQKSQEHTTIDLWLENLTVRCVESDVVTSTSHILAIKIVISINSLILRRAYKILAHSLEPTDIGRKA